MKYRITQVLSILSLTALWIVMSCATAHGFSAVQDKDWKLIAVKTMSDNILLDRNTLAEEGFGNIFTLRFDSERVNGIASPNRYFAPYTLGEKKAIAIRVIAQTQMASLFEIAQLTEREYFVFLQNVYEWKVSGNNLELYSKDANGSAAIMAFVLAD